MTGKVKTDFPPQVTDRYEITGELGHGAYGIVCAAINKKTGQKVAVKKITRVFDKELFSKRSLRELKLLKHFSGHENITSVLDMEIEDRNTFNEIYLVQDLMEADLHQIIRSQQPLSDSHFQYFIYQVCRGLKYIHSAQVLHRDLKPGNLLVNADCDLKICDFGLARGTHETIAEFGYMTEYVATRWYRAPEIMLSAKSYTKASRCFIYIVDMWSVGTILAELVAGNPLFKDVDQLNRILAVCGTQDDDTLRRLGSKRALQYIKSLKVMPKLPFSVVIPNATTTCVDLLENLLQFDPEKRFTVEQALEHPYLEAYHDINEEPSHPIPLDFSFELLTTESEMRQAIADEVMQYRSCTMTSLRNGQLKVDPYVESNVSAHGPKNENFQMIVDSVLDMEEELRLKEESASF